MFALICIPVLSEAGNLCMFSYLQASTVCDSLLLHIRFGFVGCQRFVLVAACKVLVIPMDSTVANFEVNKKELDDTNFPWLFSSDWNLDRSMWKQIAGILDVQSVPSLMVLDKKFQVLTRNGLERVKLSQLWK